MCVAAAVAGTIGNIRSIFRVSRLLRLLGSGQVECRPPTQRGGTGSVLARTAATDPRRTFDVETYPKAVGYDIMHPYGYRRGVRLSAWRDYQQQAAAFFRTLGLAATVEKELQGARGTHKVDVYV